MVLGFFVRESLTLRDLLCCIFASSVSPQKRGDISAARSKKFHGQSLFSVFCTFVLKRKAEISPLVRKNSAYSFLGYLVSFFVVDY